MTPFTTSGLTPFPPTAQCFFYGSDPAHGLTPALTPALMGDPADDRRIRAAMPSVILFWPAMTDSRFTQDEDRSRVGNADAALVLGLPRCLVVSVAHAAIKEAQTKVRWSVRRYQQRSRAERTGLSASTYRFSPITDIPGGYGDEKRRPSNSFFAKTSLTS